MSDAVQCPNPECRHRWTARKAKAAYVPRRRCPNCFKVLPRPKAGKQETK
jgi:hypothetical protein